MERRRTILLACAAIAGAAMLCGCSKTEGGMHLSGAIQFGMASRGGQTTKTVYGDKDATKDGKTYQPLNWAEGDVVTIASPQAVVQNDPNGGHASNYVISQITLATETDPQSKAKVVNEAANGLMWLDNIDTYDFYAIYPKNETGVITLTQNGAVEATIPAAQDLTGTPTTKSESKTNEVTGQTLTVNYKVYAPDMKYAFMTGALKSFKPTSNTQTVPIVFNPAFTAFEFNVSSQDDPIELTKFEIVSSDGSDKLAGKFTMTAGGTDVSATGATSSVTADLSAADAIDDENGLNFTVFTVPVTNTQPLRIKFRSASSSPPRTARPPRPAGLTSSTATTRLPGTTPARPSSSWRVTSIASTCSSFLPASGRSPSRRSLRTGSRPRKRLSFTFKRRER